MTVRVQLSRLKYQNKLLKALRDLDAAVLSSSDFNVLSQEMVNIIRSELGYIFSAIVLIDKNTNVLKTTAISYAPAITEIVKALPIDFRNQVVNLAQEDNILVKVVKDKKEACTNSLSDLQKGTLPVETSQGLQNSLKMKGFCAYPLITKNEAIGVIYYASIQSSDKFSKFEFEVMQEISTEVSMVLENAMLLDSLKKTKESMSDMTKEIYGMNAKLHQLDKLKDDFVSVVSHELRTPMTVIRSYAWMALHKPGMKLSDQIEKYLIRILLSTERLINLVNDMLNISRIESGKIEITPEPIDLISLSRDIIDEVYYSKAPEKKIDFVLLEQKLPKVFADPNKLRQVLLNITGNALKFSPMNSKITVSFQSDGQTIETFVKDEGPGISKDDMQRLFTKFGRLDNSYTATATSGGTGLGLYISKILIEKMHGKIWAISEGIGKGTTFIFSLPIASQEVLNNAAKYTIKPQGEVRGLEPVAI